MPETTEGQEAGATPETEVPEPTRPTLQILTPSTTPEEVAAIVAVLSAVGGQAAPPAKRPVPAWSAPHRGVRRTLPHGPGGWRASGLPR